MDGLTGVFFFGTADAARLESGEVVDYGRRPVAYWQLKVSEGETPKNLRARVELFHNGEPVDAYYVLPGFDGSVLNELVLNNIERTNASGLAPRQAGPRNDGTGDEIASSTGIDFEFRLSEISVSDIPFTPTVLTVRSEQTVTIGTVKITVSERQSYCESFASITPGWFETTADVETLADPGSTPQEKQQAMRRQVIPDLQRTHPYDCDLESDAALFADFVQDAEANKETGGN